MPRTAGGGDINSILNRYELVVHVVRRTPGYVLALDSVSKCLFTGIGSSALGALPKFEESQSVPN
jgi:hypothetical protein